MSGRRKRDSAYEIQRSSSSNGSNTCESPSQMFTGVEQLMNGHDVSKSNIDFFNNLSANILSIKGSTTTTDDFSCYFVDSFKAKGRKVSIETTDDDSISLEDLSVDNEGYFAEKSHLRERAISPQENKLYQRAISPQENRLYQRAITPQENKSHQHIPKLNVSKDTRFDDEVQDSFTLESSRPTCSRKEVLTTKTNACHTVASSSSTESTEIDESIETNKEWRRLDAVLSHIDPVYLVEYLGNRIKRKDLSAIKHLSPLFPKSTFSGDTSHCLRCHKEYDPQHGDMVCVLYHEEEDVDLISQDQDCALFQCERCFAVFKLHGEFQYTKTNASRCGHCYAGTHTDVSSQVDYEPEGVARRCEDSGCFVFFV